MVVIMSKLSASHTKHIALNYCTAPNEAYVKMMGTLKAVEMYLKILIVRNRFSVMIKNRLATEEVRHLALRMIGRNTNRLQAETGRIMKMRMKDIEWQVRKLKYEWFQKAKEMRTTILNTRVRKMFYEVEREFRSYVWKVTTMANKKKIQFALDKNKRRGHGTEQEERFYLVTDSELNRARKKKVEKKFEVYGDIVISQEEKECLSLGPKYMTTPRLNREDFEVEVEVECVKTRLELIKRKEVMEDVGTVEEAELEHAERQQKEKREIFDQQTGKLTMSKMAVTDTKFNTRSFPPRESEVNEEILIQARKQIVTKSFEDIMGTDCDESGKQKKSNMTEHQSKGKKKLMKRVKEGEIVITTTDKSGKYAVVEPSLYKEAAKVHLKDDEITMDEVKNTETLMNRHAAQIIKSLKMGTRHGKNGQEDRIRKAFTSIGARPGPVSFLVKDHKGVKEGERIPPTRQVCSAKGGPSSRLSNLVSTILNKAADAIDSTTECQSTEDLKREILETNRKIEERCRNDLEYRAKVQRAEIVSLDVKALYPSMKLEEVRPILSEMLNGVQREGKLELMDVEWHEMGKYLAILCDREELERYGVESVVPTRTAKNRGPRPGPAYWEDDLRETVVNGKKEKISKWNRVREPDQEEGQNMITLMLIKAVEVLMRNHTYRFDGKMYKQRDGGPIGDELSQAVARLVMLWWDKKYIEKCERCGVELLLFKRYVDDVNQVVIPPEPGVSYEEGAMRVNEDQTREDEEGRKGKTAGKLCKSMADSINRMLEFEDDVCENHKDGKMPILDLKVWIEKKGEKIVVKHTFYKKLMANRATLKKGTAYPTEKIKSVMIEEVMRRLRNCTPESSWNEKGKFLTEFAHEMKESGHSEKFRVEVFNRAVMKYKKELVEHLEGRKDIYRSREERRRQLAERGGRTRKDDWFRKRGRGGEKTTSVLRVPYTNGRLKKKIGEIIESMKGPEGTHTRVQEDSGDKLRHEIARPDPFTRESCGRLDCNTGEVPGECRERCYQDNVNYSMMCVECERERSESGGNMKRNVYIGESSRGCYVRFKGHESEYRGGKGGVMMNHARDKHDENRKLEFIIKREKVDKDPMRRILRESIRINKAEEDETINLMNSKDEYFGVKTIRSMFTQ